MKRIFFLLFLLCSACDNEEPPAKSEYIFRRSDEIKISTTITPSKEVPQYPWESMGTSTNCRRTITKEYFRCKGSSQNPPHISKTDKGEEIRVTDCGGGQKHSLPLLQGQEYVYPILLKLLNHIQTTTNKTVIITSGHRCPDHNTYIDPSIQNATSKHVIGAAVDFYISGLERTPEAAMKIIEDFYKKEACYKDKKEFQEFKRYEKPTNCSTPPWLNKEILVKIFKSSEGRNGDNTHAFPYITIEVRFDCAQNAPVVYSWPLAQQYLRK